MNDLSTLVEAVADASAPSARLVLADWLEEHGQRGRAEFVQASLAAAEDEAAPGRAEALLAEHERQWLGPWCERLVDWGFERGFLARVRMTSSAFLAHGAELMAAEPVERLELVSDAGKALGPEEIAAVVAHPAFARVRDCAVVAGPFLDPKPLGAWFTALAANRAITKLRRFGPVAGGFQWGSDADFDQASYAAFCRAPHLSSLRELDLRFRVQRGEDRPWLVSELAAGVFAPSLESLRLRAVGVVDEAVLEVARNPAFANLRSLDLGGLGPSREPWQALFESPHLSRLSALALSAGLLPEYAGSRLATQVRQLTLGYSSDELSAEVSQQAWATLLERAPRPHRLDLRLYNPGTPNFRLLAGSTWLSELRSLTIRSDSQNDVFMDEGTAGVEALFGSEALPALRELRLHELGDAGLAGTLSGWRGLERLTTLELTDDYHGRLVPTELKGPGRPGQARVMRGLVVWSAADAQALLGWAGLEHVRRLYVSFCLPDGEPPEALTEWSERVLRDARLAGLEELTLGLSGPRVEPCLAALADPRVLPRLRNVHVYSGYGEDLDLTRVRERFGLRLRDWLTG